MAMEVRKMPFKLCFKEFNSIKLALVAFAGVLALLVGFYAVYAKMRATAGLQGAVGFLFIEAMVH